MEGEGEGKEEGGANGRKGRAKMGKEREEGEGLILTSFD